MAEVAPWFALDQIEVVLGGQVLVEMVNIEVDQLTSQTPIEKALEDKILIEVGNAWVVHLISPGHTEEGLLGQLLIEVGNIQVVQWRTPNITEGHLNRKVSIGPPWKAWVLVGVQALIELGNRTHQVLIEKVQ